MYSYIYIDELNLIRGSIIYLWEESDWNKKTEGVDLGEGEGQGRGGQKEGL